MIQDGKKSSPMLIFLSGNRPLGFDYMENF